MTEKIERKLDNLDERLRMLESALAGLLERLDRQQPDATKTSDRIKEWVTQFVAMRLHQLVPETWSTLLDWRPAGRISMAPRFPALKR
jgi:predicted nuclease with TOPRIM domain